MIATNAGTSLALISAAARMGRIIFLLSLVAGVSQAAKGTPFGSEMIGAHFPSTTSEDVGRALQITTTIGGHSMHIWLLGEQHKLDHVPAIVSLMRQIGSVAIDTPAPPLGMVQSFADPHVVFVCLMSALKLAMTKPDYLILCTEANLLYRFNRPEFENFRTL